MRTLSSFLCGLLFGVGLVVAGMSNPAKVLNFLDLAGTFDPSLAFVMAGAVAVAAIGFPLVVRRPAPLLGETFQLPTRTDVTVRLVAGAAIFGAGWGLVGLCPGPAMTAITLGGAPAIIFVVAMFAGFALARAVTGDLFRRRLLARP